MGSLYVKGAKLWARYKDEHGVWKGAPSPYRPGDEANARRFLKTLEAASEAKSSFRRRTTGERKGPIVVAGYAERWVADRKELGLVRACDDDAGLKLRGFPHAVRLLDQLSGWTIVDEPLIRDRHDLTSGH
jgi:hypothetical protein